MRKWLKQYKEIKHEINHDATLLIYLDWLSNIYNTLMSTKFNSCIMVQCKPNHFNKVHLPSILNVTVLGCFLHFLMYILTWQFPRLSLILLILYKLLFTFFSTRQNSTNLLRPNSNLTAFYEPHTKSFFFPSFTRQI